MSEGNGSIRDVLKIERKGMQECQLDDGPRFKIDVLEWCAKYAEVDREFRDENNEVPPQYRAAHTEATVAFVKETFKTHEYTDEQVASITRTEALEFLRRVGDKAQELRRFFEPATGRGPSSPGGTELTFSGSTTSPPPS